jgi:D-lactate dehydrogenase
MAAGFKAVCAFVADELDAATLLMLAAGGARLIALRSAGCNNVDLAAAAKLGLIVLRVPAYSPHAVAEHAVALMLTLNRRSRVKVRAIGGLGILRCWRGTERPSSVGGSGSGR